MSTEAKLNHDIIEAMRLKDSFKVTTLRMVKAAIKNKEIEKRTPLTEVEVQAVLSTAVKQRKDSIEQFTKGDRLDLAVREQAEITLLEVYMPREIGPDSLKSMIFSTVAEFNIAQSRLATGKDMGTLMKLVKESLDANGLRADGGTLSKLVKEAIA
jgi:uncharacterized protein YqeY